MDPMESPFTLLELYSALSSYPNWRAPGPDGLTVESYKYLIPTEDSQNSKPPAPLVSLLSLLNSVFLTHEVPSTWYDSSLVPLHKKGDPLDPNNYRGISLMNCHARIFMLLITRRIYSYLSKYPIIAKEQGGFLPHRETLD